MKKLLLALALLPMMAQGVDIQTIQTGWKTKVINDVPTGGLAIMLERFDMTWPTAAVGDVCQVMQTGVAKTVLDSDDGYTVEVDAKNGYAESYTGGSDRQYMQACVWRRSNGHRLFAVVIGQPVDPEIEIICFYDYDPQKHTLTPEPKAIGDWIDRTARGDYSFKLPKVGKELLIFDHLDQLKHHFKWDGMRPVFDSTEQMADVTPESFPGGLADDGRGPEETEPDGTVIQYDGEQYIRVHTAEQFLHSIISGCNILVAKDTEINLTPLLNDKAWWDKQNYYFKWCSEGQPSLSDMGQRIISEAVFDGRQLVVQNYKQMLIRGEGNSRLVVEPRYAFCIKFMGCEQVEIRNLTIGHTTGGYCQGGVIGVEGGWRISLRECDLYGCGTYGLQLSDTRDFSCYKSVIHDCTYGIMTLKDVEFAKFEQCDFFRNREFSLVESRGSNVTFYECRFYDNNPTSPLFDFDREFFLAGCSISHPTEKLGTIHLADQSGAKNCFDPNDDVYALLDGAASPLGYVGRYLKEMERLASEEQGFDVKFDMYDIVDIDGDGRAEIVARQGDENYAAFAVGSGRPELLVLFDSRGMFLFYQGAVGFQGSCGTGCYTSEHAVVRNSRLATKYTLLDQLDMSGKKLPAESVYEKDGQPISAAEAERIFKSGGPLGSHSDYEPAWQHLPD